MILALFAACATEQGIGGAWVIRWVADWGAGTSVEALDEHSFYDAVSPDPEDLEPNQATDDEEGVALIVVDGDAASLEWANFHYVGTRVGDGWRFHSGYAYSHAFGYDDGDWWLLEEYATAWQRFIDLAADGSTASGTEMERDLHLETEADTWTTAEKTNGSLPPLPTASGGTVENTPEGDECDGDCFQAWSWTRTRNAKVTLERP